MYTQDQKEKEAQNPYLNVRHETTLLTFDNIYIKLLSIDEKTNEVFSSSTRNSSETNINLISYTVNSAGYIDFPFVGEIYVKDLTLLLAKQRIEEKVGDYLPNPAITVKFVNNVVTVLGEVNREGEYPFYRDQVTIFQALGYAGGATDFGNLQKVTLIREANDKLNYYYLDLTQKEIVASPYYYLIPNDVIVVRPVRQKFRNLSLVNWPLFLTTITTMATLYLLFSNK